MSKKDAKKRRAEEEEVAFGGLGAGRGGKRRLGGFGAEFDDLLGNMDSDRELVENGTRTDRGRVGCRRVEVNARARTRLTGPSIDRRRAREVEGIRYLGESCNDKSVLTRFGLFVA
jgi:hypothetical protein